MPRSMLPSTMQINSFAELGLRPIRLALPLVTADAKNRFARDLAASPDGRSKTSSADAPRVLLVDDSEKTLSRARTILSASCTVVGTATCGASALAAAASWDPDVVVLDISMPGMNGFELAKRLRTAGCTAQLVYLTVHEEEELILAARNAGALGYVLKTRIASDLAIAIREARAGRSFQSPPR